MENPVKKYKRPPTPKAKLYLDKYPTVNEAFNRAKWEDSQTLNAIYDEGVDINYDVDAPNKLNMFSWSITAHGACDPHFLELMFTHDRSDIDCDGQKVFESACKWGDPRHIEIFMKRFRKYQWNLFEGMKSAIQQDNRTNLHHLLMYITPSDEERDKMWELATDEFISGTKTLTYMVRFFGYDISRDTLTSSIVHHFGNTLSIVIALYLITDTPFKITRDTIKKLLLSTHDRMYKLDILNEYGFEIEDYEKIKAEGETTLPKPSKTMYYSTTM